MRINYVLLLFGVDILLLLKLILASMWNGLLGEFLFCFLAILVIGKGVRKTQNIFCVHFLSQKYMFKNYTAGQKVKYLRAFLSLDRNRDALLGI